MKEKAILGNVQIWLVLTAAVIGLSLLPATSFGQNVNPGVLPTTSKPYGMTYGEWSARWWQWAIGLPADHHPLTDTADCSTGQLGAVWFLGGPFWPADNPNTRNCNVPVGKALFFPIINTECSDIEPAPWFGDTIAARQACAKENMDPAYDLFAEIDGVPVQDLQDYRVMSPNFYFTAPEVNILGVPGNSGQSVGDGYYLMVAPLRAGPHTIHFSAAIPGWSLEVTYHITVVK